MTRASAGAALRALRESRDWSLADLAAASGVSVMGLSYLERGARKPHKSTIQKVENALGLPPGSYAQLVVADDPQAELARLVAAAPPALPAFAAAGAEVVVDRHTGAEVLEGYAQAQIEALDSVIARLPPTTSDDYETYIRSVIAQCVKAELLAAGSWRVAVNAGADPAGPLLEHLRTLERTRVALLARLPASLGAHFDRACAAAALPATVIAVLLGISTEQLWEIRCGGPIPAAAVPRVGAFTAAVLGGGDPDARH
ncbi:helix-turn-helix transcriptional regulator [Mycolicibacillus parakoreensis]|uniref:Helix-turn-helix domain-containing protein n=1 Tax=Mycolicibacillus parakoreensis TaxID=1069221 RepID=A0ABY3U672_9MYCO|nr:helix-turn-helix transcriptional regulator [Mycolicibacillus parakoreensis]MCV7314181.1 helix-turn-helix transcriptional regulator [Mycolicibacillus parakoreensis]ULN52899.1 helix-turn-helix domain-containing protein [Mycolicibacillus parakoreensis]